MKSEKIIKFSSMSPSWPFKRQTPGENNKWGDCKFIFTDQEIECDYWVVSEGVLIKEKAICNSGNTLLFTTEPPMIKTYSKAYLRQFANIFTCHKGIGGSNVHYTQPSLPWHIGRKQHGHNNISFSKNYDELINLIEIPDKNKKLSVIASDKQSTPGHLRRYDFVNRLKVEFKDQIDVFGRGIQEIDDKWDAIAPYEFHIVLENSCYENYWTEKLSDAFLGLSFPFYSGCKNLSTYFDAESFRYIDINNFEESVRIIRELLSKNNYADKKTALIKAKKQVLDEYNIFAVIDSFVKKNQKDDKTKSIVTINPERYSKWDLVYLKHLFLNKMAVKYYKYTKKGK